MRVDYDNVLDDMGFEDGVISEDNKSEAIDFNNNDFNNKPQKIEQVADIDKTEVPVQRKRPNRKISNNILKEQEEVGDKQDNTVKVQDKKQKKIRDIGDKQDNTVKVVDKQDNKSKVQDKKVKKNGDKQDVIAETHKKLENKRNKLKDMMKNKEKEVIEKEYNKDKNSYQREEEKKRINIIPIIIISLIVIMVIGVSILVIKNATKDKNKHISLIDLEQELVKVNEEYEEEKRKEVEQGDSDEITLANSNSDEVVENIYNKNEKIKINYSVNTKLESDTEYKDYETYLNVRFKDIFQGYDNVISYITEYNKTGDTLVEIGNKKDFYSNYYGNEIVLYEFEIDYDENIASASGKIYNIPTMDVEIISTADGDNEGKIVVGEYAFNIPTVIPINIIPTEINVGDTVTYRYVAILPSNASADSYNLDIKLNSIDFDKEQEFKIKGQQINNLDIDYEQLNIIDDEDKDASKEDKEQEEEGEPVG